MLKFIIFIVYRFTPPKNTTQFVIHRKSNSFKIATILLDVRAYRTRRMANAKWL